MQREKYETFRMYGYIMRVYPESDCSQCALYPFCGYNAEDDKYLHSIAGECAAELRDDGEDVIFKSVTAI